MIEGLISFYKPVYLITLVYMLQRTEYEISPYLKWHWHTNNFNNVMKRGSLNKTKKAKLILITLLIGILLQIIFSFYMIYRGFNNHVFWQIEIGLCIYVSYPLVWAYLITIPLVIARIFIVSPRERKQIEMSKKIFKNTKAIKIAVAGSYGKTTMKELLAEVLSVKFKMAVTPENKNTALSQANFALKLDGSEEVIVVEFGEGKPGDVSNFTYTLKPNIGIITGLAPAHLDHYLNIEEVGRDIFSLADFLKNKNVYVNSESDYLGKFTNKKQTLYSHKQVGKYKIKNIKVFYTGIEFELIYKKNKLQLSSGLIGKHQVGPLATVACIGLDLGMTVKQIEEGISITKPFEHRMQPRKLGGAWIIDDTYNGNIDGMKAGLALFKELESSRKIYITPGLVDQGNENINVHQKLGRLIAKAKPNEVILMKNSVTEIIQKSLESNGYKGIVKIEQEPLKFYTNLEQYFAKGDLVIMQNDWPDNYL